MEGIGKLFMQNTQYGAMGQSPQEQGLPQPPLERPLERGAVLIPLPKPEAAGMGEQPLIEMINQRRSLRKYSSAPLTLQELSFLLWCCQGVQRADARFTLRTVPSAGARHAFETYVLINRVEGLQTGVYRYSALNHALVAVDLSPGVAETLTAACLGQGMVGTSAAAFFWAAELERMYYRYGERGYRYLHLDAGHACQNLCLAAESVGSGACEIAAFGDEAVNEALGLDGESRFVVYIATVGKKI